MASRLTLKQLYNKRVLFTKVEALIEEGQTFDYLQEFLEHEGVEMSRGTLVNLKKKINEAKDTGVNLGDIIDRRGKAHIDDVPKGKLEGFTGEVNPSEGTGQLSPKDNGVTGVANSLRDSSTNFWSTESVLDEVIQKGYESLNMMTVVDISYLLKAVEMKDKLHGAQTGGLTLDALKQYQIINEARVKAMQDVLMEYVPTDKQEDALKEMDKAEREVLDNLEVSPDGRQLLVALRKEGLDL